MEQKVTGIVLAGGKSKRMGMEKGLVEYNNKALIEYALDAIKPHCNEILISSNSSIYDYLGFPIIPDIIPDSGPMGGIYSCLLRSKNRVNFVLSCDTPLVDSNTISQILEQSAGFDISIPWHEKEFFEPLCAVYHKNTIPVFEQFIDIGNFKIPDLIKEVNTNKIQTGINSKLSSVLFFNVNSKKQLHELENLTGFENLLGLRKIPNLLMIAGTGRKVGKTTLACHLIKHISNKHDVVGIKVSPHLHKQENGQKIIVHTEDYLIIEETNPGTDKDSSRMQMAGAKTVYYLQTKDSQIKEPFQILMGLIPNNQPVICESGALLNYARPGLFFLVKLQGQTAFKKGIDRLPYTPDQVVTFDGMEFDLDIKTVVFAKGKIQYK